jgi:hypothetical protein
MRNFYGQLRVDDVSEDALGIKRRILHGRINHGEQFSPPSTAGGRPPTTARVGNRPGAASACRRAAAARSASSASAPARLATYGRSGDEMRMYEINEQVLDLARSEFSYLGESRARIEPVLGDGRLMLEARAAQNFDLLAIDAFSGDSIPTHLLTLEAMQSYLPHICGATASWPCTSPTATSTCGRWSPPRPRSWG